MDRVRFKSTDKQILRELRRNARTTLTKIAAKTNVPLSTVFDRVHLLEESIIVKYVALIDFIRLGYYTRAHIAIGVDVKERLILKKYLLATKHVNNLYRVNNGYDFLVEAIFVDIKEYEDFLNELKAAFSVTKLETHLLLKDLLREEFFTKENGEYIADTREWGEIITDTIKA